jgi:hypothetical protein
MSRERKSPIRENNCRDTSFIAPLIIHKATTITMRISKGLMALPVLREDVPQ